MARNPRSVHEGEAHTAWCGVQQENKVLDVNGKGFLEKPMPKKYFSSEKKVSTPIKCTLWAFGEKY